MIPLQFFKNFAAESLGLSLTQMLLVLIVTSSLKSEQCEQDSPSPPSSSLLAHASPNRAARQPYFQAWSCSLPDSPSSKPPQKLTRPVSVSTPLSEPLSPPESECCSHANSTEKLETSGVPRVFAPKSQPKTEIQRTQTLIFSGTSQGLREIFEHPYFLEFFTYKDG